MTTLTRTFNILGQEFDLDQLNDIATHGCAAGVSGFIYSSDLYDIWVEHGVEILRELDSVAEDLGEACGTAMVIKAFTKGDDEAYYCAQNIKETAIWMYVELQAVNLLTENGHMDWV